MRKRLLVLGLMLSFCATLLGAGRRRSVRIPTPPAGPCPVRGIENLFYSLDGGTSWSQNAETRSRRGASGMAVIAGSPETLVVVSGGQLFDSTDGGCTWTLRYTITEDIHHALHLVPGVDGRAYFWWEESAYRYDRGVVTRLNLPKAIGGLGANPANREHVRILDLESGVMRESFDGGDTWHAVGASVGFRLQSSAFDPTDFDHILAGQTGGGIAISRNAGRTWKSGAAGNTICNIAFVVSQPNVVWVTTPTLRSGGTFVWRSTDGGAHLEAIGSFSGIEPGVCLTITANPHDANLAYVPFNGFNIFDAALKSATPWSCCGGRISAIAWSPTDASRVYVVAAVP